MARTSSSAKSIGAVIRATRAANNQRNSVICKIKKGRLRRREPEILEALKRGLESRSGGSMATIPGYLEVTDKDVVHGMGVKALRDFKCLDPILYMSGEFVPRNSHGDNTWAISTEALENKKLLDLDWYVRDHGNIGRFINSCSGTALDSNCRILFVGVLPFVFASRDIRAGEELLMDYDVFLPEEGDV